MIHDGKPLLRGCHSGLVRSGGPVPVGPVLVGPVLVGPVPVGPVPVGAVPVGPVPVGLAWWRRPKILGASRRPQTPNFSNFRAFSGFSARFPGFSWSGMVWACPGTHFHAQKSIFHHKINF